MKRALFAIAAVGLLAAACGGSGTGAATAAPKASPTPQTVYVFTSDLAAANEVPPVTDAEASGTGTSTVTLTTTKDASGKITAATAKFEIVLKGFPATTSITISHIHKGDSKTAGPVVVDSGMKADSPAVLTGGGTTITKENITVTPDLATDIIANPGNYYYNVHSAVNKGGVVRAQLKAKS